MIRSTALLGFLLLAAGCRTAKYQARHLASRVVLDDSAEEVERRLGPPAWRHPPSDGDDPSAEPGTAERWTYRVSNTLCWKIGWWIRAFTPLLCVTALRDFFGYADEWLLAVDFGENRRVLRATPWTPPRF